MKDFLVQRLPTTPEHTEGFMSWLGGTVCTMERPWIEDPDGALGGKPNESCVPAGIYKLIPHKRSNGTMVVALVNHDLGVFYTEAEMLAAGKGGRFKILIHIANWVHNIIGCIGPGVYKADSAKGRMVSRSGPAMKQIMDFIDGGEAQITIEWI